LPTLDLECQTIGNAAENPQPYPTHCRRSGPNVGSIPPQLAVSDVVRRMKGRSSHKVQREFPALKKRYWGRHFWARGYFCTTSGNVTDDVSRPECPAYSRRVHRATGSRP
jgi:hypothetical protein